MSDGSSADTLACPSCGKEIRAKAMQCRYCREWVYLTGTPVGTPAAVTDVGEPAAVWGGERAVADAAGAAETAQHYSNGQLAKHLLLLSVLTLGLYEFYWFYRNWCDLRDHSGADVSPGWRTAGLLVPFLNIFIVYQHLTAVRELAESAGEEVDYTPGVVTAAFFGLAVVANLTMVWAVSLLTVIPLLPVQATLNRYWQRVQPDARIREDFESHELVLLAVGAVVTMMAVVGTLAS